MNCERQDEPCDYSIRLNWGGRSKRDPATSVSTASNSGFSSPYMSTFSFGDDAWYPPTPDAVLPNAANRHNRSTSRTSPPRSGPAAVDPELVRLGRSELHPSGSSPRHQHEYFPQSTGGQPIPASFQQSHFQTQFDFPSPTAPAFESFGYSNVDFTSVNADAPLSPPSMLPPRGSADSMYKRHKSSHSVDSPATTLSDAQSPYTGPPTPYNPFLTMPLTPNSSVGSEETSVRSAMNHQSSSYPPPDLRRLSVQSLVNNKGDNNWQEYNSEREPRRKYPITDSVSTTYGYDTGLPDFDTPRNKDHFAIAMFSPPVGTVELNDDFPFTETEPRTRDMAFGKGGYYAEPVQIRIPKSLEPLPPILMENKMNLLYFHHFINHTARILVPHDCERNPFRQILPESKHIRDCRKHSTADIWQWLYATKTL